MHKDKIKIIARNIRKQTVSLSHSARIAHLGSSLSCVDILACVYFNALNINRKNVLHPERDRFILSKGHAALALYVTLAQKGLFSPMLLNDCGQPGSLLAEHPIPGSIPGLEAATGSLGHGLSIGLGMTLAGRIQLYDFKVLVLLSDGECNEGSVWEAAMFAAAQHTENLVAIIDYNKWQATGRSDEIMALSPLKQKWSAFGWNAREVDGHNIEEIAEALRAALNSKDAPYAIIANTIKGRGVSFMEDDNNWHYRIPTAEEVMLAHQELDAQ